MQLIEIFIVAFALSLDAFAVSLAASVSGFVNDGRATFRLAFHFGLFQFLMPVLGWTLGTTVESRLADWDHWIAFAILLIVGIRMITAAVKPSSDGRAGNPSRGILLVMLAIATSIDAMAVGFSLAILGMVVWYPSVVIGLVTAGMSILAIVSGNRVGGWLGSRAQIAGGVVLILIGIRIALVNPV